jgi:hypothetical protein
MGTFRGWNHLAAMDAYWVHKDDRQLTNPAWLGVRFDREPVEGTPAVVAAREVRAVRGVLTGQYTHVGLEAGRGLRLAAVWADKYGATENSP